MRVIVCLAGLSLMLIGCAAPPPLVSEAESALETCSISQRTFRAQRDACEADNAALQSEFTAFQENAKARLDEYQASARALLDQCSIAGQTKADELSRALDTLGECQQGAMLAQREIEALQEQRQALLDRESDLRGRLQTQIAAQNVEIEVLKNRLSVRVLDRILFDTGSAEIRSSGVEVLSAIAEVIADGQETIRVEGHTDDVPISENLQKVYVSNWELSGARAASVVRFFQHSHGIAPDRLMVAGFSYYRPVAPNDTPENRQRNRRVEIILSAPST